MFNKSRNLVTLGCASNLNRKLQICFALEMKNVNQMIILVGPRTTSTLSSLAAEGKS